MYEEDASCISQAILKKAGHDGWNFHGFMGVCRKFHFFLSRTSEKGVDVMDSLEVKAPQENFKRCIPAVAFDSTCKNRATI